MTDYNSTISVNGLKIVDYIKLDNLFPDLPRLRSGHVYKHVPSVIQGEGGAEPLQLTGVPRKATCDWGELFSVFFGELNMKMPPHLVISSDSLSRNHHVIDRLIGKLIDVNCVFGQVGNSVDQKLCQCRGAMFATCDNTVPIIVIFQQI